MARIRPAHRRRDGDSAGSPRAPMGGLGRTVRDEAEERAVGPFDRLRTGGGRVTRARAIFPGAVVIAF
jgi:hypothetical protein